MEGIDGAAWRLLIQTWAHPPYGVLAGMLMLGNKQGGGELPRSVVSASGTIEMSRMEDRSSPVSLLDIPEKARSPAINDLLFN